MDANEIFNLCMSDEKYSMPSETKIKDDINLLVDNIETDYKGGETIERERQKEKDDLTQKIKDAEKKLKNIKTPNMGNSSSRKEKITSQLSEKREKLRREIARYKVRLSEIETETGQKDENADDTTPIKSTTKNRNEIFKNKIAKNKNSEEKNGNSKLEKIKEKKEEKKDMQKFSSSQKKIWNSENPYSDVELKLI
jgi:hypothetical protein